MSSTRVLVVDDDPIARQLYAECLETGGHDVVQAGDAAQARQALARGGLDVVVTDLILPDGDGLQVLAEAKRRDPGVEVVVITAVDRVDPAVRAIKSGAADYLVKPVPPEVLQLSVSRCLATRQLLKENALLRQHLSLVESGQRLAASLDRDALFPSAVRAFAQALSASAAVLLARRAGQFTLVAFENLAPDLAQTVGAEAAEALASGRPFQRDGWRVLQGEARGEIACACLLLEPTADVAAWTNATFLARHAALALDNLDRLRAAEDLAFIDDLTGLHNLRFLQGALDREVSLSRHSGAPFSVLFLDLDRFKTVNDTHGHLCGSKLLVEMAALLRGCVREGDVAVRYGGDEYVIVLHDCPSAEAEHIAERIRRTVEVHRFLRPEGLQVAVTVCVGVASFPEHGHDAQAVLDAADRAMYQGKQTTRNRVSLAA